MNKQIFLAILLTLTSMSGYSQIEKKTLLLGGYANFNYLSSSEHLFVNLNPNTGLFLSDKFCLGVSMPIVYLSEQFYWGISPFARYYLKSKESKSLYFSGSIGLTSFLDSENTLTDRALALGVGHVWLLNKSIGFETEFIGSTSFSEIEVGIFFGFQVYLNRSKSNNE